VVDINYPYNIIFGRGLLNNFEASLHSLYLCLKVPAALGVISNPWQSERCKKYRARFALGHKNVNCLQDEKAENSNGDAKSKNKDSFTSKPIELECESKRVPFDPQSTRQGCDDLPRLISK
jgi:hypothetical protein